MLVDRSIPPYSFQVAGFNATPYLKMLSISTGTSEMNKALTWTGDFEVEYTIGSGVTEDDFDHDVHPDRWCPNQAQIILSVRGYPLPVMRLAKYVYNPQTRVGKGQLHQILDALDSDRPSVDPELEVATTGVELSTVVNTLIQLAIAPLSFGVAVSGITGTLDAKITTRNPIVDAQKLCATNWQWLWVDPSETLRAASGDPDQNPMLFTRSLKQVEFESELDNLEFSAEKVIVTGARQVPKKPDGTKPEDGHDDKGRPTRVVTEEKQPAGVVFPTLGANTTEIVAQRKTVYYQYAGEGFTSSYLPAGLNLAFYAEIEYGFLFLEKSDTVVQTVTVQEEPAGKIFPELGTNSTLRIASIDIETEKKKASLKPFGVLFPGSGVNFEPALASRETITQGNPNVANFVNTIDPKTGKPIKLEPEPQKEPRQIAPEIELETQTLKGECSVTPTHCTPLIQRPRVEEVGFVPSQAHIDNLARQIAFREMRRREAVHVVMEPPIEWLQAGCPPFARCQVHNCEFQMDELILAISDNTCTFSFTGGKIGTIPPVPNPPEPLPFIPTGGLQLIVPRNVSAIVNTPIEPIQLIAVGGNP